MATRTETRVVNAAGAAQGIVLVTFPAASTIFTSPDEYDLSNTQYGVLFVPQVVTAIAASLLGARLARRFSAKRVYLAGLAAGLVSMSLLIVSRFFESDGRVPAAAGRDGLPRRRLRADGPHAEHVHRRVPPRRRRSRGARAQRAARPRHRARAGARRDLRRPGLLVGPAGDVGRPARRAARVSLRLPLRAPAVPAAARRSAGSRCGSGSSPALRSSMACARR